MSRIHEALKKAEEERAALQETGASMLATAPMAIAAAPISVAPDMGVKNFSAAKPEVDRSDGYLRIDHLLKHCAHPQWHLDPNVNVFINSVITSHGSEQFRTLRSRLYQMRASQPLRTLLVTSSVSAEGKTFVTNNFAQSIVRQPDRRALIIDADLRCSRLHVPLGAPASPGLTDYLRGDTDEMGIIQFGLDGNLCFIPGGNQVSNPSELLSNGRLKTLLERVTPLFDWVVLDSPPCLAVADASVIADLCDGVLFVARAGVTPAATAQRAAQELQGKNVVGVVLNAVNESHAAYSHYYYHYGYGESKGSQQ